MTLGLVGAGGPDEGQNRIDFFEKSVSF